MGEGSKSGRRTKEEAQRKLREGEEENEEDEDEDAN